MRDRGDEKFFSPSVLAEGWLSLILITDDA